MSTAEGGPAIAPLPPVPLMSRRFRQFLPVVIDVETGGFNSVTDALLADADEFTWVAAVVGANSAAGYQLATERPVMAIGGFNGSDPAPTLAEFQARVAAGEIHYFVSGGQGIDGGQMGGSQSSSEIADWVASNYQAMTISTSLVYRLS